MSLVRLAFANLTIQPLSSIVSIFLLALGVGSITVLLLANAQLGDFLKRNAAGIDLVIGAKGSPLQLVLSGIYHADVPPGNIAFKEVERWAAHPMVKSAVPLSMGDSFEGYRIVGTTAQFVDLYDAKPHIGRLWRNPFEAVVGSRVAQETGLKVGDPFSGSHGFTNSTDRHDENPYLIVGQLAPTGSVIDNLIVTSTQSVWMMHRVHDQKQHPTKNQSQSTTSKVCDPLAPNPSPTRSTHRNEPHSHHVEHHHPEEEKDHNQKPDSKHFECIEGSEHSDEAEKEVTLLLITLSSPLGILSLPREVNATAGLQAASPAYELTRLMQIVGIGIDWLNVFAVVLVISAALSIFAALYSSLRARRQDLAVLRCLGASRSELFQLLLTEGFLLTTAGISTGLLTAHGGIALLGYLLLDSQGVMISGWMFAPEEIWLIAGLFATGLLAAALPAWQAYRTDVARTLTTS